MREMSLQDVQSFSLEILKDVHAFCVENNINYSLAYGTLIGAVRHQGFIPWDDDIDIIMPRPDYDRFCREYHSDKFKTAVAGTPSVYIAFSRVYDDQYTFVENRQMPWASFETGVWIDIFPIDAVCDDYDTFINTGKKLQKLWIRTCHARNRTIPFLQKGITAKAKTLVNMFRFPGNVTKLVQEHL